MGSGHLKGVQGVSREWRSASSRAWLGSLWTMFGRKFKLKLEWYDTGGATTPWVAVTQRLFQWIVMRASGKVYGVALCTLCLLAILPDDGASVGDHMDGSD